MNPRTASWLAWATVVLVALVGAAGAALMQANGRWMLSEALTRMLVPLAFVAVGALIVARQPRNRIGWLFCCASLLMASGLCAIEYAVYALRTAPGVLPGGVWLALYGAWARDAGFFLVLTFLPLIFPTGRLVSPRWHIAAWLAIGVQAAYLACTSLTQFTINDDARLVGLPNPLSPFALSTSETIQAAIFVALLASCIVCGASLYVRFRRGSQVERQQLKWLIYAVTLSLILAGILWAALLAGVRAVPPASVWLLLIISLPISTTIAILRYRLYDIDLIINRTLVYASLTLLLAAVYFGSVIGLQHLVSAAAGSQAGDNPLIIVLSTLLIAALFMPLRRHIQATIDHRFYRRKYDAFKTLAAFSATLRSETDLDQLSAYVVGVIDETMQPAHVSLWLRAAPDRRRTV